MIRFAKQNDFEGAARIHAKCFPNSYVTQLSKVNWLGKDLLPVFYQTFFNDNPEPFVVAEDDNHKIAGFCMGYYMDRDDQIARFMVENSFWINIKTLLFLLIFNKYAWNKLLSHFLYKSSQSDWTIVNDEYECYSNDQRGDLLSVCVSPECRGKQYAQGTMELYLKSMKGHGQKPHFLSVKQDNSRAIHYYERNGFELYRTRGDEGYTFIKAL